MVKTSRGDARRQRRAIRRRENPWRPREPQDRYRGDTRNGCRRSKSSKPWESAWAAREPVVASRCCLDSASSSDEGGEKPRRGARPLPVKLASWMVTGPASQWVVEGAVNPKRDVKAIVIRWSARMERIRRGPESRGSKVVDGWRKAESIHSFVREALKGRETPWAAAVSVLRHGDPAGT